ncbi:hypothetical protein L3Q82_012816 [Scortum barcoo]|uniref:Uncharacterized protein n=1 Tax=Scortum barcoo TaxID=214431 RepID=A0ACB8W408_9TELE|nr:hypothetical protein L3Q82_012816 [Scortum barcoo]
MRISTSKSEAMVLDRKRVVCPLQVGGEVLPQVEEFKYLGVLFTSEGKMEREIDRRIGAASAVMRSVYRTVVVKKELSRKAVKLSIYWSIYAPTLTYGHKLWEELGVEPLLLHIERSQLRWLVHLFRMPPGTPLGRCSRHASSDPVPDQADEDEWMDGSKFPTVQSLVMCGWWEETVAVQEQWRIPESWTRIRSDCVQSGSALRECVESVSSHSILDPTCSVMCVCFLCVSIGLNFKVVQDNDVLKCREVSLFLEASKTAELHLTGHTWRNLSVCLSRSGSNLLFQPIISASCMHGVSEAQQQEFQVFRGSTFTIS